ncbi:hypothetical protein CRUP_007337, partial [Coryphaenoides rupestris]
METVPTCLRDRMAHSSRVSAASKSLCGERCATKEDCPLVVVVAVVRTGTMGHFLALCRPVTLLAGDQGQDVEHGGHVGVVVAGGLLQVLQGLLAEGHGHLVAALRGVLDHQVVEGAQAGRDLVAALLGRRHRRAVVLVLHSDPRQGGATLTVGETSSSYFFSWFMNSSCATLCSLFCSFCWVLASSSRSHWFSWHSRRTWARSFCFSDSTAFRWLDSAIITWRGIWMGGGRRRQEEKR